MNALEIKGLSKSFGDFALKDIDLVLPEGCIVGLIGENGAGKSTTIKLILDMIDRDAGSVRILGRDNKESVLIKNDIGVVPDSLGIPECFTAKQLGKVLKNIFSNWDEGQYAEYLKRLDLPEDKEFGEFSKGMKMKLGIAAALSHHPKLLILDEATSGLDPVVRDEVVETFGEFTRDESHSVLMSSHIVSDLEKICDYIAFIHEGKLLLCEEKDALKERFAAVHCTQEELAAIPQEAVLGKKSSVYGVEALVRRDAVPEGMKSAPAELEQIFIYTVKGAKV